MVTQTAAIIVNLAQTTLKLQRPYQLGLISLQGEVEGDLVPLQLPIATLLTLAIPCSIFCTAIMLSTSERPSTTRVWLVAGPEMRAP